MNDDHMTEWFYVDDWSDWGDDPYMDYYGYDVVRFNGRPIAVVRRVPVPERIKIAEPAPVHEQDVRVICLD